MKILGIFKKTLLILLAFVMLFSVSSTFKTVYAQDTTVTYEQETNILLEENENEEKQQKSLVGVMIVLTVTFIVLCFAVFIVLDYKLKKHRENNCLVALPLLALYPTSHLVGVGVLIFINILAIIALIISIKFNFLKNKKDDNQKNNIEKK